VAIPTKPLKLIGTTDCIDLPEFNMTNLECKIDTGAETSSIHCSRVTLKEREGKEFISFHILDNKHPEYTGLNFECFEFKEKKIKSSFGSIEFRFAIKANVILFGKVYPIWFTLSDREKMRYPVLLGKGFLKNRFLVDVSQKDLSFLTKPEK
jgi:hypothetical protein